MITQRDDEVFPLRPPWCSNHNNNKKRVKTGTIIATVTARGISITASSRELGRMSAWMEEKGA